MLGLVTGTFAVVSLMTGSVVEQLVPTPLEMNLTSSEATDFEAQRIGVASAVALLSGIAMVRKIDIVWLTKWKSLNHHIWCLDTHSVYVLCCSSVCLAFSWASSPPICQSQLLRRSLVLQPSMSPSHSCKACWDSGFLATLGLSPCLRYGWIQSPCT